MGHLKPNIIPYTIKKEQAIKLIIRITFNRLGKKDITSNSVAIYPTMSTISIKYNLAST